MPRGRYCTIKLIFNFKLLVITYNITYYPLYLFHHLHLNTLPTAILFLNSFVCKEDTRFFIFNCQYLVYTFIIINFYLFLCVQTFRFKNNMSLMNANFNFLFHRSIDTEILIQTV